jgi:hypothetical protein
MIVPRLAVLFMFFLGKIPKVQQHKTLVKRIPRVNDFACIYPPKGSKDEEAYLTCPQ